MNRRPSRLMPALAAGVGLLWAQSGPAAQSLNGFVLKLDAGLSETRVAARTSPAFARAWVVEGHTEDQTTLIGEAEVRRAGSVIRGDRITYTQSTDELTATGNVLSLIHI